MKTKKNWIEGADAALKRAALRARELAERTGTPLYGWKDGRVVNLLAGKKTKAEQLPIKVAAASKRRSG